MSFLQELQKYDLHCHLDGSLSVDCIRTMAEHFSGRKKSQGASFG